MTIKELEVRPLTGSTWFTSASFEVWEIERNASNGRAIISEIKKFKGTITECKAYVFLLDKGFINEP